MQSELRAYKPRHQTSPRPIDQDPGDVSATDEAEKERGEEGCEAEGEMKLPTLLGNSPCGMRFMRFFAVYLAQFQGRTPAKDLFFQNRLEFADGSGGQAQIRFRLEEA